VTVAKKLQDFFRVIADGRQLDPLLFESRNRTLQLDQLPFAEWSPVGRTEKEKDCTVRAFQRIESLCPAKLVANRKSGCLLPDREPDGHQLDGSQLNGIAIECSPDGHRIAQLPSNLSLGLKAIDEAVRVVVKSQLRAGHAPGALGRLIESLVGVARAGHQDARPRSGLSRIVLLSVVLLSQCEGGDRKQQQAEKNASPRNISSDRQYQSGPSFQF
jgi:hypothetical protein